jgi:hypothetical protein
MADFTTAGRKPRWLVALAIPFCVAVLGSPVESNGATIVDLTIPGNSGAINGALFEQVDSGSTGTGVIDSFVQQQPGGNGTTSHAYNTTSNNILNNASSNNFNHSIFLGNVSIVARGNRLYREFFLDINESGGGGDEFLSLDEVQIFVGGTANSSVTTFTGPILNHDGTLVYRMDNGADNWVALDYSLNAGSGSGDMILLVPNNLFRDHASTDVVTLYSRFGLQGTNPVGFVGRFGSSGGFEEWALRDPPIFAAGVPELMPSSVALTALIFIRRFRRRMSAC